MCVWWRPLQVHGLQLACDGGAAALRQPAPPALQRRPAGRPVAPRLRPAAGEPITARQRAGPDRHHPGGLGDPGGPGERDPPGPGGGWNHGLKEGRKEERMVDFFLKFFFFRSFFEECEEPNEEERVWTDALTRPLSFTPTPADPKSEPFFLLFVYKHTMNAASTLLIGGGGRCQAPPTAGRSESPPMLKLCTGLYLNFYLN